MQFSRPFDFAIIGAAKSGTSAVSDALTAQRDVEVLSPKDGHVFLTGPSELPTFRGPRDEVFNRRVGQARETYRKQLKQLPSSALVGDSSVFYMAYEDALTRLRDNMTDSGRVIVLLRHPADRAYSAYMHMVRDGVERLTFTEALENENARKTANWQPIWQYTELGFYSSQVEASFDIFGRDRVQISLYEDVIRDPMNKLAEVLRFIGSPTTDAQVTLLRNNMSGIPRSRFIQDLLDRPSNLKHFGAKVIPRRAWLRIKDRVAKVNLRREEMPYPTRQSLTALYTADIKRLETIAGLDLSQWTNA